MAVARSISPLKNLEPDFLAACLPARGVSPRARLYRAAALSLAVVAGLAVGLHFAGNAGLNRFVRPRVERAFAARVSGGTLRLGALRYDFWRDRLRCAAVDVTLPGGASVQTGAVSIQGVHWVRLLGGKPSLWPLLRHAHAEVADLSARFAAGEYQAQCGQLRVSVPEAEIAAQAFTLQPTANDEAFFAADAFRRVRYRLTVASAAVRGAEFRSCLEGQAYRAAAIEMKSPVFDSFIDREKPRRPPTHQPPMPHDALAAIQKPFRIDRFTLVDGGIRIAGRRFAGATPGVLTFTALRVTADGIANAAAGGNAIGVVAQGNLMDAGAMTVRMNLPVAPATFAFHYAGELGAMDLTRLDEYLRGTGGFALKSGRTSGAAFDVDVADGHARGVLRGAYRDLQVTVLDRETGSEKGVTRRVATVLANELKVRRENPPETKDAGKDGRIDYARAPGDTFLQFTWLALRSGIMDLITL